MALQLQPGKGIQSCHGTTNLFIFSIKSQRKSPPAVLAQLLYCKFAMQIAGGGALLAPRHATPPNKRRSIECPFVCVCKNRLYSLCSFAPAFLRPAGARHALCSSPFLPFSPLQSSPPSTSSADCRVEEAFLLCLSCCEFGGKLRGNGTAASLHPAANGIAKEPKKRPIEQL